MEDDNGKALAILDQKITALLEDKSLSTKELIRGMLEVQQSTLPFFNQMENDHKKVIVMWGVFRPALAAGTVLVGLATTLFWNIFTGRSVITKP